MRGEFREGIEDYKKIITEVNQAKKVYREAPTYQDQKKAEEAIERLEERIARYFEMRAEATRSNPDAQRDLLGLQKEKQAIMAQLKKEIAALDSPEKGKGERLPNTREIISKDGELFWRKEDGKEVAVTLGEIVTDGVWGIEYHGNEEAVPRVVRKRLLVDRAHRQIQDLLDDQILTEELASRRNNEFLKKAYSATKERRESGALPHGIMAEKMMTQLVRKKIIDDDAPFTFDEGDVFQDVVRKIDFVIRRSDYGRGVRVDDAEQDLGAKAVQLTINKDPQTLQKKISQIDTTRSRITREDRIDDIALVQLDQRTVAEAYRKWITAGSPPGGPDKMLAGELRESVFKQLVEGMGDSSTSG